MTILLRNMAEIKDVPKDQLLDIMQMYSYESKGGELNNNFTYKDKTLLLPPNMDKLKIVSEMLGRPIVDKRTKGKPLKAPFELQSKFNLRDYQILPSQQFIDFLKVNQYGMLQGETGSGKTSVTTYVSGHFNCKVLVLCDMGNLQDQWQLAFKGVWGKDVQIISSKDKAFADVCCATFQMLNRNKELLARISEEFGFVIIDEAHVDGATCWKNVLLSINSYYRSGISATIFRKGFSQELLTDLIGPIAVEMKDENKLIPKIRFVNTGVPFCSSSPDDFSKILSKLAESEQRNHLILQIIRKGTTELDRKILVVAPRIEQLKMLYEECKSFCKPSLYVGSTNLKEDLKLKEGLAKGEINVILSSKKMNKGVDMPDLDVAILATPCNNEAAIIQVVGRILRKVDGKPQPVVFDLVDEGSLSAAFKYNRSKWYKQLGFEMGV